MTDSEHVDVLFPNDEDYFEWRGPARAKFEFRIQKVEDRLPVSGEFVLGGSHGALSGTLNPVDKSIEFHFSLLHQVKGRLAGTGLATLSGFELSIRLDYVLPTGFELPWTEQELGQLSHSDLVQYLSREAPELLETAVQKEGKEEASLLSLSQLFDLLLLRAQQASKLHLTYHYVCLREQGE